MDSAAPAPLHVDPAFVRRILVLAQIEVEDERIAPLVEQMTRILQLVSEVQRIPIGSPGGGILPPLHLEDLRPDQPGPTLDRRQISLNAPAHDGAFLVVPRFHGDPE